MDERGRVTIGKKIGKKYRRDFFVVEMPGEVILVPKSKDPMKDIKEWGTKAGIKNLTPESIRRLAEEEAYKEIDKEFRHIRTKKVD